MPIYEYRCRQCGREFQQLVYGGTAVRCPSCESPEVGRRLSLFAISGGVGSVASEGGGGTCCSGGGCRCH